MPSFLLNKRPLPSLTIRYHLDCIRSLRSKDYRKTLFNSFYHTTQKERVHKRIFLRKLNCIQHFSDAAVRIREQRKIARNLGCWLVLLVSLVSSQIKRLACLFFPQFQRGIRQQDNGIRTRDMLLIIFAIFKVVRCFLGRMGFLHKRSIGKAGLINVHLKT